jgi:hypothetical protein
MAGRKVWIMKNAWCEVLDITDEMYRSQLSGYSRDDIEEKVKRTQNHEHELLIEALNMIVEIRNRGRS